MFQELASPEREVRAYTYTQVAIGSLEFGMNRAAPCQ